MDIKLNGRLLNSLTCGVTGVLYEWDPRQDYNEAILQARLTQAEDELVNALEPVPTIQSISVLQTRSIQYTFQPYFTTASDYATQATGDIRFFSPLLTSPRVDYEYSDSYGTSVDLESFETHDFFSAFQCVQVTRCKARVELLLIWLRLLACLKQAILNSLRSAVCFCIQVVQQQRSWYLTHGAHPPRNEGQSIRTPRQIWEGARRVSVPL